MQKAAAEREFFMKSFDYRQVSLTGGYLADKEEMNRKITINAVYDRFYDTGRITAFHFDSTEVHFFWDSDVAKWMEGAAYILAKHPDKELEAKVESLIDDIEKHQGEDGYFNIYFTVREPEGRFKNRDHHELYCAGHLFEAAVAYAEATGRERFLHCMEKYAAYIHKVFMIDKSAAFTTPGHEEIELALLKMYRYTKNKLYLDMAAFFINERGKGKEDERGSYNQSHLPVREQTEALGHSVRAVYLYTAMADLAYETGDEALKKACDTLYRDIVEHKMYITGGIGSTYLGETFTVPFDLPNEEAYTETCAGIGLMFFCERMQRLENKATYADTIERVFYNGVLSGISLDGKSFFYENPLEITLLNHFSNAWGTKRYPITQRLECFGCSCCPPNVNRLLPKLCEYVYAKDGDTLYINQFASSILDDGEMHCEMQTDYPRDGRVHIRVSGAKRLAVRKPSWCRKVEADRSYTESDGYMIFADCDELTVDFDMTPFAVRSTSRVVKDVGKLCVQAGPIVYCAESVDNGKNLHQYMLPAALHATAQPDPTFGLNVLDVEAFRLTDTEEGALYARADEDAPQTEAVSLRMIPYSAFANRGESDMLVWFNMKL